MLRIHNADGGLEWLVRVEYEGEYFLVKLKGELLQVYNERELPESPGVVMKRPTNLTSHRAAAIECVRRLRYGEHD